MASQPQINNQRPSFKQQNLPAWQPNLTAGTVLPAFFFIGVAFLPIGIGLLISSITVQEKIIDYTACKSISQPDTACSAMTTQACECRVDFELEQSFKGDVYVYYGLTNFYQNHRRYVKSRDDNQLLGNPKTVSDDCAPFEFSQDSTRKPIAPCGAIANSLFNDSFKLELIEPDTQTKHNIVLTETGIAWSTDKTIKFRNPYHSNGSAGLKAAFDGTIKPLNWRIPVYELSENDNNNGFQNEHLIVWMRTAALPTFRKLWATVDITASFQHDLDALPSGKYSLVIQYNYPVTVFNGRKQFILSNMSWLGGRNHFLGIAYIVVGCICFVMSSFFLYIHKKYGRLPSEMAQMTQTLPHSNL